MQLVAINKDHFPQVRQKAKQNKLSPYIITICAICVFCPQPVNITLQTLAES